MQDKNGKFDFDYYCRLEQKWKRTLPKYSLADWFKVFPEVKDVVRLKILEVEAEKNDIEQKVRKKLKRISLVSGDIEKYWLKTLLVLNEGEKLARSVSSLSRFYLLKKISDGNSKTPKDGFICDKDICLARQAPITQLIDENPKKSGGRLFVLCPFHQEKTPSCCVYPEDNRFYCFGCQEHGDVIDFVMKKDGLGFVEAVKYLNRLR